jgi:hypothetical protein
MGHILDDALVEQTRQMRCHVSTCSLAAVIRPQITPMNVMPIWWNHKQWREQFSLDVYAEANITIESVKEEKIPDFSLRLCPNWTGADKSGHPKKGERHKLALEKAMAKGKSGAKRVSATKSGGVLCVESLGMTVKAVGYKRREKNFSRRWYIHQHCSKRTNTNRQLGQFW